MKSGIEQFHDFAEQLEREIKKLKLQIQTLSSENNFLKNEIEELKNQSAVFGDMPEKQKLILKKQIGSIISRIDKHLEAQ